MADQPSQGPREAAAAGAVGSRGGRSVVHDPLEAARRAQTLLPDNQTELWPDAGHGLPTEFPDQFNARLLKFVS